MSITPEDVEHVARLARLSITPEETTRMTSELGTILDHVGAIASLAELEGVPPTTHVVEVTNVWGEDTPHESLTPEQALANAPDAREGAFRVPRMQS